jgi:two-component system sensor histidine kinase KdpD
VERAPESDVLYIPIGTSAQAIGVLEVRGRPGGGRFDDDDRNTLTSFANQAALALDRVRLSQEAARAEVLAQSDELKSALLAAVSHDLRTPLAAIKTSVTSLMDASVAWDQEARSEFLDAINEETDRLTLMVSNLLDLSRIEGGALRPDRDWYDVDELVSGVRSRLASRAALTGHQIASVIEPGVSLGYFDYVEIEQVLMNLVENALKYTPAGSTVTITAREIPSGLEFSVIDNGPGIDPASKSRLFEKFYRSESTSRIPGTGIGLAICRGLVEAHGGRIWVESELGRGTTFTFTIPFDRDLLEQSDAA